MLLIWLGRKFKSTISLRSSLYRATTYNKVTSKNEYQYVPTIKLPRPVQPIPLDESIGLIRIKSRIPARIFATVVMIGLLGHAYLYFQNILLSEHNETYVGSAQYLFVSTFVFIGLAYFNIPNLRRIPLYFSSIAANLYYLAEFPPDFSRNNLYTNREGPPMRTFVFGIHLTYYVLRKLSSQTLFYHCAVLQLLMTTVSLFLNSTSYDKSDYNRFTNIVGPFTTLTALCFSLYRWPVSVFSYSFPVLVWHYIMHPFHFFKHQKRILKESEYFEHDVDGTYSKHLYACNMYMSVLGIPAQLFTFFGSHIFSTRLPYKSYHAIPPSKYHDRYVSAKEDKEVELIRFKDLLKPEI